jgi:hypothetical protein
MLVFSPWQQHVCLHGDRDAHSPAMLTCERCGMQIPREAFTGLMGHRIAYSHQGIFSPNPAGRSEPCRSGK